MKLEVKPGKYVVAVSGGVDSMVLLDVLSKDNQLKLVVAHFDHGIRQDSYLDAELVRQTAKKLNLKFELAKGNLGESASEDEARQARYKFLDQARTTNKADGIITAHQQDDVIETAIINVLRGTGPKGLGSLVLSEKITRPLLNVSKADIKDYAVKHKILWREDVTNEDTRYLRNYVRKFVVPRLSNEQKQFILFNVDKVARNHKKKEIIIAKISHNIKSDDSINRERFSLLPSRVGSELLVNWMRDLGYRDFDKKTINQANILIRTAKPNTRYEVSKSLELVIDKFYARFK